MKRLSLFLFIFGVANISFASSIKAFSKADVFFFGAMDVIEAYEGKWLGEEELFLKGRLLGNIKLQNENKYISSGALSSVGIARMADEVIDINANIIALDNKIYLMAKDENSRDIVYEGLIKSNSVEWFRTEKIFAYDYTKDVFSKKGNTMTVYSYSVKPHLTKSGNIMYLEHKGSVSKDISPKIKLKINPIHLDISKLRI